VAVDAASLCRPRDSEGQDTVSTREVQEHGWIQLTIEPPFLEGLGIDADSKDVVGAVVQHGSSHIVDVPTVL
jgi:hypothetical protein